MQKLLQVSIYLGCSICLLVGHVFAQSQRGSEIKVPSQAELNGFVLGQHIEVLKNSFGEPFQTETTDDGWTYRVYKLASSAKSYMVFKSDNLKKDYIYSIQIAGDKQTKMYPFVGLVLGDSKEKLIKTLGSPSGVTHDSEENIDLWKYEGRNYSFEVNSFGLLSSIQIFGYDGFPLRPEFPAAHLEPLRQGVTACNLEDLLSLIAPDVEIYKQSETLHFVRSARADLSDPKSGVYSSLCGDKDSLREMFRKENPPGDAQLRLYEKEAPACVYKFEASKIIKEIVFQYQAGRWKAWEIRFR